jgi:glycerophosphoryl diester phosphodiesterase
LLPASPGISPESERIETVLPAVIGHRGAAKYAPENTLAGLRKAKSLGCHWVEFDVRLTADGQPVLLHDNRLERTTNGRGRVSALSLVALEEALMLLAELGLGANVELKAVRGKEAATGAVVAELLARAWPADPAHLLISSFHRGALAAARDRAPHIARGILFRRIPKNWRNVAAGLGCVTIHADHQRLRPAVLSEIRRAGYPLLAYTVNDPERAKTLFDFGVKSVFSDVPDRLHCAVPSGGFHREVMADWVLAAIRQ